MQKKSSADSAAVATDSSRFTEVQKSGTKQPIQNKDSAKNSLNSDTTQASTNSLLMSTSSDSNPQNDNGKAIRQKDASTRNKDAVQVKPSTDSSKDSSDRSNKYENDDFNDQSGSDNLLVAPVISSGDNKDSTNSNADKSKVQQDSLRSNPPSTRNLMSTETTSAPAKKDSASKSSTSQQESAEIARLKKEIAQLKANQRSLQNSKTKSTDNNQKQVVVREVPSDNNSANRQTQNRIDNLKRQLADERAKNNSGFRASGVAIAPSITGSDNQQEAEKDTVVLAPDSVVTRNIQDLEAKIDSLSNALQNSSTENADTIPDDNFQSQQQILGLQLQLEALERQISEREAVEDSAKVDDENYEKRLNELKSTSIFFDISQAQISGEGKLKLDNLIIFLKENEQTQVSLKGYTDPTGNAKNNMILSKKRAQAVNDYFISKEIASARISIGYIGTDNTLDYKTLDYSYGRRVEVILK